MADFHQDSSSSNFGTISFQFNSSNNLIMRCFFNHIILIENIRLDWMLHINYQERSGECFALLQNVLLFCILQNVLLFCRMFAECSTLLQNVLLFCRMFCFSGECFSRLQNVLVLLPEWTFLLKLIILLDFAFIVLQLLWEEWNRDWLLISVFWKALCCCCPEYSSSSSPLF